MTVLSSQNEKVMRFFFEPADVVFLCVLKKMVLQLCKCKERQGNMISAV